MKVVVIVGGFLFALSAAATSIAPPMESTVLGLPGLKKVPPSWLDDGKGLNADSTIQPAYVARLVAPLLKDPETAKLVDQALKLSGQTTLDSILKVCPWTWGKENWTQGQTNSGYVTQTALPRATDMSPSRRVELKAFYKKKIQDFVAEHPNSTYFVRANAVGYAMMIASQSADICLAPNLPLATAQTVLVHELVHFGYPGGSNRIEVKSLKDADEYSRFRFTSAGGEADAFRAGFAAAARWNKSTKSIPADVQALFDAQGNYLGKTTPLVSATGKLLGRNEDPVLEKYVLKTLGYEKTFIAGYYDVLGFFRGVFSKLIDRVQSQLEWAPHLPDVQEQIALQIEELNTTIAVIDAKLPPAPAATPTP